MVPPVEAADAWNPQLLTLLWLITSGVAGSLLTVAVFLWRRGYHEGHDTGAVNSRLAAMASRLDAVETDVARIKSDMRELATKNDLVDVRNEIKNIEAKLDRHHQQTIDMIFTLARGTGVPMPRPTFTN
jgi:hypothetical protein